METITLAHGAGGQQSAAFIKKIILKYFGNPLLNGLVEKGGTINFSVSLMWVSSPLFMDTSSCAADIDSAGVPLPQGKIRERDIFEEFCF